MVKRSVHGPVIAEKPGKALALRVAGLDQPRLADQYWRMIRARNLNEFQDALALLQMPMFTVMYADGGGHILHLFGGRTPRRPAGDYDWSRTVPGDTSKTFWTQTHAYEELPRALDPESGWLQNANDPPWTTTFPVAFDPRHFPRYMAPRGMGFRPQRSARMLAEDASLDWDELLADKHSTRMEMADRLLDDLADAVQTHGDEAARRGLSVLQKWDRTADNASRGGTLFAAWVQDLPQDERRLFATPWSEKRPRETPDGLADPKAAAATLRGAVLQVEKEFGAADVAWGEVHRLRRDGVDLPANGGDGELGIFRVTNYGKGEDGRFVARGGDSYVAVVEFGSPQRARTLVGYGNWSQRGSKHRTDQLELYSRKDGHGLIDRLAETGRHDIVTLDVKPLDGAVGHLVQQQFVGSILDTNLLERILSEFEVELVFHLAARFSTRGEFTPETAHRVNVEGTLKLLEFARWKSSRMGGPSCSCIRDRSRPTASPTSKPRLARAASRTTTQLSGHDVRLQQALLRAPGPLLCPPLPATRHRGTTRAVDFRCCAFPASSPRPPCPRAAPPTSRPRCCMMPRRGTPTPASCATTRACRSWPCPTASLPG